MEIVTAIVTPVVQSLMVPVKKHLGYLISCKKYVRDMGTKRKDLDDKRVNVEDHKNHNERNIFVVPTEVDGWLEKVRNLEEKAASISDDVVSCFNINHRHNLGRKAFKIIEEIDCLIQENDTINWTDRRIPPAKVNSKKVSTSTPSSHHNDFTSREWTFMEALKQLQPDHKTRMIALCGMGGVGKTTMMEKLKKAAEEKKLFNMIVKVAIGEKTDPIVVQQSVADFLGIDLKESDKGARAINLRKSFEATSNGGKKKILVILDDVWELVDLNDIGLSPFPNQGVGFKILLTSRIRDVCTRMEVDSIFNVETIEDHEAQSFFHQCVRVQDGDLDFDLREIGDDIANRCHGLPMAIKTIASFLKCYRNDKWVWENTLSSLKNKKVEEAVYKIFEISYNHLQDEEIRSTLLLCGVFPEDFDTPREDLVRYGWGLRLFNNVHTIRETRNRVNTYIEQLINANLLIRSQLVNHVQMHDLVRAFVLKVCSNSEHASIIGDISKWSEENTSEICKRISLTCTGMSEFPRNFKFPKLSLLKLMHGDKSLKFPEDFYEDMNKLQVIAYDKIEYPLLSRSLACSTNIRTLCLYRCSLMFDCSPIGDLLNLEVLSFAACSLNKLPSTIGNLKELKLLDLTGCVDLIIDDGVLKNLIKLEELYVKVGSPDMFKPDKKAIRFSDSICNELAELSKNLFALEIEFFDNNALPKNMSFKKLERFKISLGCYLDDDGDGQNTHSYENTLMLVTNKCELLDSRMNELFKKTGVLRLQVNGVNNLGDGLVESLCHQRSPFYNLRVLEIRKCENLRYLFTVCVANGLTKLERLTVLSCPVLETLVDGESGELGVIKFQVLKFLSLGKLPELTSLCNDVNVIELPQLEELILDSLPNFTSIYPDYYKSTTSSISNDISTMQPFLNNKVVIPRLSKLKIFWMERLKEIWPSNLMSLLHHLEELEVSHCGSIEVLFDIDLGCVGKNKEVGSCLRSIRVRGSENLREVWRIKGPNDAGDHVINGFQAVESLEIESCKRFRNVFSPTTTNFDMRALTKLTISNCGESERADEMVNSRQEINVAFPSYLIHTFHNLHTLEINLYKGADVVFEIETPSSRELATTPQSNQQPLLLPYLKDLKLENMKCMSHVWKCNWNTFLISQKQPQSSSSSFQNLTRINLARCKNIKYVFSPLMAELLSNLKNISIRYCDAIEEVVSNRDDEDEELVASTSTNTLFPHLDTLYLLFLPNLKCIGGASGAKDGSTEISSIHDQSKIPQVNDVAWSLCQYSREIEIHNCQTLPYVIPSYALGQMQKLENLTVRSCKSLVEVFKAQGSNIDEASGGNDATMVTPRMKIINVPHLSNLKDLVVDNCNRLQHVFTFSTLESLRQLEKLSIRNCKAMKVIVKEDNGEQTTISSKVVLFPRLKSIKLCKLPNLAGFFLGMDEFRWPLLDFVMIDACPQMMVFTSGRSIAPKLNYIHTELGKYSLECGLNFPVMAATLHESPSSSLDTTNSCATTSKGTPWFFRNLIEIDVKVNGNVKNIIPSNELLQLQKLEKINVYVCSQVEEVFEALEGTDSNDPLQYVVVEIPKLKEVKLKRLENLKYIWKNNRWMVLEFPNLTKLSIYMCNRLEHVFSSSMVSSLLQLQDLHIYKCDNLEVIVKEANVVVEEGEEECDDKVNEIIMLPRLKSLKLEKLPSLKGFYLRTEAFTLPSLDTLEIIDCPAITVFTKGDLATPELKVIHTSFGRCELVREEDLNSFINTKLEQGI